MKAIAKRVSALEQYIGSAGPARWVRIIVDGKSTEQARAEYEAEHGPIGEDTGIIFRTIVTPKIDLAGDRIGAARK